MCKIRKGKDLLVRWPIKTNGEEIPLAGRDLTLEMRDNRGMVYNPPFTTDGIKLMFMFYGKDQTRLGAYTLTLWENKGKIGETVVDAVNAFTLVQYTTQETPPTESDLTVETIDLDGSDIATSATYLTMARPYSYMERLSDYLYRVGYDNLDYDYALKYFLTENPDIIPFGCSSVRNGNFYGRNFDWYYNQDCEFVVRTPHIQGRNEVIGVAGSGSMKGLDKTTVESGVYSELYKILPFFLRDGINEHGVFCNVNVVPCDKGESQITVPDICETDKICNVMIPRFVLDKFSTATEAVNYLRDHVAIYPHKGLRDIHYELHAMIGDAQTTYVVEFYSGKTHVKVHDKMTNFHVDGVTFNLDGTVYTNADVKDGHLPSSQGITPNASGLERYNKICSMYESADTLEGMRSLMDAIRYSRAYDSDTDPYWCSEFVSQELGFTVDTPAEDASFQTFMQVCREHWESRDRDNPEVWHTAHSCVYDIAKRKVYVISQEESDMVFVENMRRYYTAAEVDALDDERIMHERGKGEGSVQTKGTHCLAKAAYSTAEGYETRTIVDASTGHEGLFSHAEGYMTNTLGQASHAEGVNTVTNNRGEHAEGCANVSHTASDEFGHRGNTIHSVGIGNAADVTQRKNAYEVMQNGDIYIFGLGGYDGTNAAQEGVKTLQQLLTQD